MYSVILVEDDYMQRNILKKMLTSTYNFIKIYEADSESEALNIIENNYINMFIIDINLKESSGLDLAKKIRDIPKYEFNQIIFLTTYIEYITQAFKQVHCYDYILKPYNKDVVYNMLNKIILNENKEILYKNKEIVITLKCGIYIGIKIKDIIFIEVIGKKYNIHTKTRIYSTNSMSLKKIIELIDSENIIQSHRSFVVNINYVCKIEKIDNKLSSICFNQICEKALLGYKFKNDIISKFKKDKVVLC
ncbi:response regulator transcription factor [Clostridium botulinum]|uniref:LytR/AlgR family response regulator transcription factor n=1 Tax=Clostridium botulinum TaxID=1491 RepID=UPI00144D5B54|nr:LytTR family DNA-binding domain-containing protein [Clostridium botulinum]NFO03903.1 response regulator transcription factor [Clostridium botulinum]UZP03897.1 response regulator transcription factor [Clostridium botulinum]UZP07253.1 response regulator transcription factor [Clostridium botulinum]UZP10635.1 response regulator transcription factor [Clostridium botulinum]